MPIGEICNREVVFAERKMSVPEAARLMRQYHVGDLVVAEERDGQRVPVGIVTDRDIVVEVVAKDLDPATLTVGDIMSLELVSAREKDGVFETLQLMRFKGVRRIPVLDDRGGLAGIVTVDDLIELFAEELGELAKLISREQAREAKMRV
jgi:CBS domain-containing protein